MLDQFRTQYQKHYENDAEELNPYDLFKKSKARVTKHDDQSKEINRKERTRINRVAQRDVTKVIRSGEWFNMESRNLVPGDLVRLTLGGLTPADCAGRLDTPQTTGESLLVAMRKGDRLPREACYDQRVGVPLHRATSPSMCGVA